MTFYSLEELVSVARSGSRFYQKLYEKVPEHGFRLEDIPVADFREVMSAVHEDHRAMFTSEAAYGMCYTTSGTTGKPKATMFGREEWQITNRLLATTHWKNGVLRDGDTVFNLSEPGSASFLAIHRVVDSFPARCSEVPLGCDSSYENITRVYRQFRAYVIAGMNPTLVGLADHVLRNGGPDRSVVRLLGGGELLYGAQRDILRDAFPNASFCSFLFGSTESGLVGYGDLATEENEFRVFDELCRVEIVDRDTSEVIRRVGVTGKLVITNWLRLTVPAIRLDTGDLAQWRTDPNERSPRVALLGRAFPWARTVAGVALSEDCVWKLVGKLDRSLRISKLQMTLRGSFEKPRIEVVVSLYGQDASDDEVERCIRSAWMEAAPDVASALDAAGVPFWVTRVDFLHFEPGTRRKGRLIVDERTVDAVASNRH